MATVLISKGGTGGGLRPIRVCPTTADKLRRTDPRVSADQQQIEAGVTGERFCGLRPRATRHRGWPRAGIAHV